MKARTGRVVALASSGLMVAGLGIATAAPASAQDRGRGDDCDIRAFEARGDLIVRIDAGRRDDRARVFVSYDRGGSDSASVNLNRRDSVRFDTPRRADRARVVVFVDGDFCDAARVNLDDRRRDRDDDRRGDGRRD